MAEGRAFHWQDLFYSYSSLPGTSEDVMFPMLPDQPGDPGPASLLLQEYTQQVTAHSSLMSTSTRQSHPKQQGFSQHLEKKENLDFFRNLRVTKDTFQLLLGIVEENYHPISDRGTPPVSSKECLQMVEEAMLLTEGTEIERHEHYDVAQEIHLPDIGGMEKSNFIASLL
ncbi:hypothetical protein Pmani_000368 [Petrolisthes manimaculis]|uniref:Uncharacterized protein n=1 Tax=Petrolisthes manimaculis TaxID=1843537 RepID=A0AAE1UT25_9EUCA|nr:hypothetical protein Pmani_036629 [Petrolisthes manimaculis]KAK4299934.1 hypothetical protein Pmani_027832 [Petrolisthes manimaculis]KAK4302978.1 hypothetical protein Pmani_024974 [Petrolisthes manimaculis]KAK4310208.1 hypothetical protein Pmani_018199 [Petrolisthes manimaculis]KAK4311062.1 hypothetical protein Pmani_017406 [Petrolisthes manimaculis]